MSRLMRVMVMTITLFGLGLAAVSAEDDPPSELEDLGLPELKITVTDAGLEAPGEVDAGLALVTFDNQTSFIASAQFIELPEGKTVEDVGTDFEGDTPPDWFYTSVWAGGRLIEAGTTARFVVDLSPGDWVIADFDGEANPVALKVNGEADAAESGDVPSDLKVTLEDHKIDFPDEVEAGPQVWEISNKDDVPHFIYMLYYPGPITAEDVLTLLSLQSDSETTEPTIDYTKLGAGPTIGIHSQDQMSWVEVDLKPGSYVALCLATDEGSETTHAEMGMSDVFTVPGDIPTS